MLTLETLPTELVLRILAYLPVQSLRSLRLVSRNWNAFFIENESSIYHHAALLHNFIDSIHTLLPEAKEAHPLKFLQDVPDWYQYCRKYFQLQRNWLGGGATKAKFYGGHPYDIHRIKIDEELGILIATHEFGGLTVFDLETTEIIWRIDATHVSRFAHCEYEKGYLIFERGDAHKEVWLLETMYDESQNPPLCLPDDAQMEAWRVASVRYQSTGPRGHFRPWALIAVPDFTRASRFVYPTLVVCGLRKAYLWDIPTGAYILAVEKVQGDSGGNINYVELNANYVFVCSTSALRIFSRQNGAMVLEIPSYQLVYSDIRLAVQLDTAVARQKVAGPTEAVLCPTAPTVSTALYTASYAEFTAVHVSQSNHDLVAQLSDSRLYVVRDFERVIRGEVPLGMAAIECGKILPRLAGGEEHFSIYLAFEHGRAGIVTTSGIYISSIDPMRHGFLDEYLALYGKKAVRGIPKSAIKTRVCYPHITFVSLPFYHDRRQLAKVTCIQMTESKLYFVWDAMYKPDNIDFFRRLGMIGGPVPELLPLDDVAAAELLLEGFDDENDEAAEGADDDGGVAHAAVPVATGAVAADDTEEDEDSSDDEEWHPPAHHGPLSLAGGLQRNHNLSTGPIVFCLDFSPQ